LDKSKGLYSYHPSSKSAWSAISFNAEVYESELERMNAAMTADNWSLQHDNKQLNAMIKEYEQTLETLMSTVISDFVGMLF
jgi:DnaJ-domain-containing protein 1